MCFPSVSAQGCWCSKVELAIPSCKCKFLTSGISGFAAVHRWEVTSVPNVNTDSFQLTQQILDSLAVEHAPEERVTVNIHDTTCHPFIWSFSVQQTIQVLSTARACQSLLAVCCASIPEGTDSTDEVRLVSQAIKESVSRKVEKPNRDWKHRLLVHLPYVSSCLILFVNTWGGEGRAGQWEWAIFFYF